MTTLTLTIGAVNFLPVYVTGSSQITGQLNNQGDSLHLKLAIKTGGALPIAGEEIVLKDGARFLFGGFITKLTPTEYGIGQLITYDLEASDYTYLLINKFAQESYSGHTLGYIVDDLMTKYINAGYGMTHVGTAAGPIITTVTFNHISLRQCFEKLAKLTNYIWWGDYQKDIHFIDPSVALAAPEKITDSSGNHESMAINTDVSQVRNQIIIQGGIQESASFQDIFVGDGQARGWVLTYEVKTMTTIELNTGAGYVVKVIGVEGTDDETACYFMYAPTRGSFRMAAGSATPSASDKIRVTYTYPLPVLTIVQDAASVVLMKTLESGDGIHGFTITDSTLVSQDQARARGLQELTMFSLPILQGRFKTRTGLLTAGSYFLAGQALTVNLPSWGINVDTTYVILKVMTTFEESGSQIEYHYDVYFGGRMLGVTDFLLALATPEQPLDTANALQKVFAVSEVITIAETITKNNNFRSISEAITIVETITKKNFTPPFKWNDTVNSNWNEAEWS